MRRAAGLGVAVALLLGAPAATAQPRPLGGVPAKAAHPQLPLSHAGRWITDARGRVVVLHGVNMVYKVAPYYPQAIGFGADDAAFLSGLGFNAVRVGVIWKAVEPKPGVYDDGYLAHIAATVHTLARHGIVSLLDFHQDMYNELFQGEGFPDWSVQDDGLPAEPRRGFNQNYFFMPALQHAYDHFWADSAGPGGVGLQERYAAAWRHVATRFRANPDVLGYELMNEPFPGTDWPCIASLTGCPSFDTTLTAFTNRVDAAIRTVDPRTLVWYEPNVGFDFGAGTAMGPVADRRAGFAFHAYCLEAGAAGSTSSCQTGYGMTTQNALHRSASTGDALLMTEFGDSASYGLIHDVVALDDQDMIPWLEWSYCPCHDPTGAPSINRIVTDPSKPLRGANVNLPALQVLVEPYPQVISGTPLSWGFDRSTRTFSFRYATARASGRGRFGRGSLTDIDAPALVYSGRYAVAATGAAVVSRRRAGTVILAACRGARTVTVRITPSSRWRARGSCPAPPGARRPRSR